MCKVTNVTHHENEKYNLTLNVKNIFKVTHFLKGYLVQGKVFSPCEYEFVIHILSGFSECVQLATSAR